MIFRTDSDIVNTKIAARYLQLEQEINKYSSSISKEYLENIRKQKDGLFKLIVERKNIIDDTIGRLREQIRSSRKNLADLYATNDLANDSEDIRALREDLKMSIQKKLHDMRFFKDSIRKAQDEIDLLKESDEYSIIIEETKEEIIEKETIRINLLNKLKQKTIENIKLNSDVFQAVKESRYQEGLWELASVDEEIIEYNCLLNLLHKNEEEIIILHNKDLNQKKKEFANEIRILDQTLGDYQEQFNIFEEEINELIKTNKILEDISKNIEKSPPKDLNKNRNNIEKYENEEEIEVNIINQQSPQEEYKVNTNVKVSSINKGNNQSNSLIEENKGIRDTSIIDEGSITQIIKSHYGQKFDINEYLDNTNENNKIKEEESEAKLSDDDEVDNRYDTDIEDDVRFTISSNYNMARSVVKEKMTRDVFDQVPHSSHFPVGEYLTLWVPDTDDLERIFNRSCLERLTQVSDKEFKFCGKIFKFLLSKDGRLFARTRNELLTIHDFIEKYRLFDQDSRINNTTSVDPYSYSRVVIEEIE